MIYYTPYHTTMGKIVVLDDIIKTIKVAFIKDGVNKVNLGVKPLPHIEMVFITGLHPSETDIPLFTHPVEVAYNGRTYLCTDMRLFVSNMLGRTTLVDLDNNIKNKVEFNFFKTRSILTLAWLNKGQGHIRNGLGFAANVYSALISQLISRAYGLDYGDQLTIQIIACYFYFSLFFDDELIKQDLVESWVIHTAQMTKADTVLISSIFQQITKCNNMASFCETIKSICKNNRLHDLNVPVLLTLVKSTWFGANAKEIMSVALEHPPTWVSMVYTALQERSYKNSNIYQYAERLGKRGLAEEFIRSYSDIVLQYVKDRHALESADLYPSVASFIGDFE